MELVNPTSRLNIGTDFSIESIIALTLKELESGLETLYASIMHENEAAGVKCVVGLSFVHMRDGVRIDGLKFATAQKYLWVDLRAIGSDSGPKSLPSVLCKFLNLPELTFVGVQLKHSLDTLHESYGFKWENVVELRSLAADVMGDRRLEAYGLFDLALRVCNIRVDPGLLKGHAKAALFARDRAEANACITTSGRFANNVGTVDVHLAFMVGNYLLGGAMPYNIPRYNYVRA